MKHAIVCPEYPPAPLPAGGIGTYVWNVSRLLADAGEIVHVLSPLWHGARQRREELCDGRLIVHRIPLDRFIDVEWNEQRASLAQREVEQLAWSSFASQCFAWQCALFLEHIVEVEEIDVIESQEYDAPLYYFQLRRALGLGPQRRPPCIVHLHSPTELIVEANEWNPSEGQFVSAVRMENFSIASADAWLCPSRYLATEAGELYGLAAGKVEVIPLPIGSTPVLQRNADVWLDGSICYVGRLEPRKGVLEWVEAALSLANDYPAARFEFIGADIPYTGESTVRQHVESTIPDHLKSRFRFRGQVGRRELLEHLGQARMAAIPSRWENFPNTCVEALSSGLPVLATRRGGMVEMIVDGHSGWLAETADVRALERTLRRALDTPSLDLCTMGRNAARSIRELCNDDAILRRHIAMRERVSRNAGVRPVLSPLTSARGVPSIRPERRLASSQWNGVVIVVASTGDPYALRKCLESIDALTTRPADVVVVIDESRDGDTAAVGAELRLSGRNVVAAKGSRRATLWNEGTRAVLESRSHPSAFALLDERDRVLPEFLRKLEYALRQAPEVGVMSCWTSGPEGMQAPPVATFPYQLVENEIETPVLVLTQVLEECGFLCAEMGNAHVLWEMSIAAMSRGWAAVVYPGLLSERYVARPAEPGPTGRRVRRYLRRRYASLATEFAVEMIDLLENRLSTGPANPREQKPEYQPLPKILRPRDVLRLPLKQKARVARAALARPAAASRFLMWHARAAIARLSERTGRES